MHHDTRGRSPSLSLPPQRRTIGSSLPSQAATLASTSPGICLTPRVFLATPTAPSTAYRSRAFGSHAYLKLRHTAGTYPVKLLCYRRERQSDGTYTWVLRKTVSAKAVDYSTYTKVTASVTLPYSGSWRVPLPTIRLTRSTVRRTRATAT